MIIDGHAHFAGEFFDADDIVRIMDEAGADRVVLCPGPIPTARRYWVPELVRIFKKRGLRTAGNRLIRPAAALGRRRIDFEAENARVAEAVRHHPGRIAQALWVDPSQLVTTSELAARHEAWGFRALKFHQCFQKFRWGAPGMHELAAFAAERGLPMFIHLYAMRDARDLIKLAAAHRRTAFVVGHLLGLSVFEQAGRAAVPNVYFDISPPNLTSAWLARRAIAAFGADHVLMGSDTPYGKDNLKKIIERVRGFDLPDADKQLILGRNALRLYFGVGPQ